ncbi:MAG TPA: phosphate signaling complex protein PhoU [Pseudogracilibacillus sp.]|nr:phosphate signaling complex protein PhoU [Pseudogracilibacillus sp.]
MTLRKQFELELDKIKQSIVQLATGAEDLLVRAVEALYNQDVNEAKQIIDDDKHLDKIDTDVNNMVILLIAKQQPVAKDLRKLISYIRISSDLERMADNAKNIAKTTIHLGESNQIAIHPAINKMYEQAIEMIHLLIEAFKNEDIELAKKLADKDNVLDSLYGKVVKEMLEEKSNNQHEKQYIIQMVLSVRYIERIGDHATNISENIIYLVKGVTLDLNK